MAVLTRTYTRTHVVVTFANPYLACDQCGHPAVRWHDGQRCGCDQTEWWNEPCGHQAGVISRCPSWGPVDGCTCIEHLGRRGHTTERRAADD